MESRRHLGAAPPVNYSDAASPPLELKQFGITEPIKDESHIGFVSFSEWAPCRRAAAHRRGVTRARALQRCSSPTSTPRTTRRRSSRRCAS
jgi:hypothetical protein